MDARGALMLALLATAPSTRAGTVTPATPHGRLALAIHSMGPAAASQSPMLGEIQSGLEVIMGGRVSARALDESQSNQGTLEPLLTGLALLAAAGDGAPDLSGRGLLRASARLAALGEADMSPELIARALTLAPEVVRHRARQTRESLRFYNTELELDYPLIARLHEAAQRAYRHQRVYLPGEEAVLEGALREAEFKHTQARRARLARQGDRAAGTVRRETEDWGPEAEDDPAEAGGTATRPPAHPNEARGLDRSGYVPRYVRDEPIDIPEHWREAIARKEAAEEALRRDFLDNIRPEQALSARYPLNAAEAWHGQALREAVDKNEPVDFWTAATGSFGRMRTLLEEVIDVASANPRLGPWLWRMMPNFRAQVEELAANLRGLYDERKNPGGGFKLNRRNDDKDPIEEGRLELLALLDAHDPTALSERIEARRENPGLGSLAALRRLESVWGRWLRPDREEPEAALDAQAVIEDGSETPFMLDAAQALAHARNHVNVVSRIHYFGMASGLLAAAALADMLFAFLGLHPVAAAVLAGAGLIAAAVAFWKTLAFDRMVERLSGLAGE